MLHPLHLHRSPDATEALNVSVDANGTGIVNLNAPSVAPEPKADVVVPTPTAAATVAAVVPPAPRPLRIEDVMAQVATGALVAPQIQPDNAPAAVPAAPATPADGSVDATPAEEPVTPPVFLVTLPPREAGGEPLQLQVSSQDEVDAFNRLNNGYARREQVRALETQLAEKQQRQDMFEQEITMDPHGFVVDRLPPQQQLGIAKALLAKLAGEHGPVFDALLTDEVARREATLEARESREQWREQARQDRAVQVYQTAVLAQVELLIPESADEKDAVEFVQDAGQYLSSIVRAGGTVSPEEVPSLLAGKVKRYGFTPTASEPVNVSGPRGTTQVPATPPVVSPAVRPAIPLTPAMMRARADAAAVIPQGAGAIPSTQSRPPKGMRIEDVSAWHQSRGQVAS